jgi:hypothetical protein
MEKSEFCNNVHLQNFDNIKPLIVTKTEVQLPYKKLLKYDKDTIVSETNKILTISLEFKSNNFNEGLKYGYDLDNEFDLDYVWYSKNLKYLENLSLFEKLIVMGYTYNGDEYANFYLQGRTIELKKYINDKIYMNEINNRKLFPLYATAKSIIKSEYRNIDLYFIPGKMIKYVQDFTSAINDMIKYSDDMFYYTLLDIADCFSVDFWIKNVALFCNSLDKIIKNSPPIEKKMIVFRGAKDKYWKKENSDLYQNNTFMSTSFNIKVPFDFSEGDCCYKKIILNPGMRVLFIDPLSQIPQENEILIGLNNSFKILYNKVNKYTELNKYNIYNEYTQNICNNEKTELLDLTVMEAYP